ncbi:MAG TPA: inositol monophosphatase family protein [Acidothermaceae bacterium]|jgi:histidinol-phosphatase|nr:inositol monophosphatase family protein [Acidothermaceae bacterium]
MPDAPLADDLSLALRLADAADAISMARFGAIDLVIDTKPDLTPVSDADRAVEVAIRTMLANERPRDAIVGEEYGADPQSDGRRWVIDPIDATKNFVRGVPVWATLIALMEGADVLVGVVSAPALTQRWWAARGEGSWTSRPHVGLRRNQVSAVASFDDASLSYSDLSGWGSRSAGFYDLAAAVWRSRAYGDFWSHMLVAEGAVDISAEPEVSIWDVAALVVIVEEAGGRVTGVDGATSPEAPSILCSNGLLHEAALAVLDREDTEPWPPLG